MRILFVRTDPQVHRIDAYPNVTGVQRVFIVRKGTPQAPSQGKAMRLEHLLTDAE
jgi:hypothetical protein